MDDKAYTLTLNADKRYYIGEGNIENYKSLFDTIRQFNHIKICLYNDTYNGKYKSAGPLSNKDVTYSAYLKSRFSINDYCSSVGGQQGDQFPG